MYCAVVGHTVPKGSSDYVRRSCRRSVRLCTAFLVLEFGVLSLVHLGRYDVAWSGDGSLIATTSSDRTVVIWDPKAGKILRMLKGHTDTVKRFVRSTTRLLCPVINRLSVDVHLTLLPRRTASQHWPLLEATSAISGMRPRVDSVVRLGKSVLLSRRGFCISM